ncbi:MAG: hypothetical protein KDC87_20755 [Planctomycetes bacterium]|nr:hypothetical protein [Planctomycetota bacterium]MCB9868275.1 hypothetical protein [Planctomycetota bacterium]
MVDDRRPRPNQPPDEPDWTEESYPLCDADFVGETLDRVMQDQSRISAEAARVDDHPMEPELLNHLRAPEPSPDFVDRTLARVLAQRSDVPEFDSDLSELCQHHHVPTPSPEFVDRTLARVLAAPRPRRVFGPRFAMFAAAAAILLCGVVLLWPRGDAPATGPIALPILPVSFGSLVDEADPEPRAPLPLRLPTPMETLLRGSDPVPGRDK